MRDLEKTGGGKDGGKTDLFRPDFLIIGAAKCATTWLQNSLANTPGIYLPAPELHYFSRQFDRGPEWYEHQFSSRGNHDIIGEKSNSYLTNPNAAARIAAACPDVRLVVQLRDPVVRAYSDYCMLYRRGAVSAHIEDHLNPSRAAADRFLDHGCYARHLRRFLDHFDRSQLLVLAYEETTQAPAAALTRLAHHIGAGGQQIEPLAGKVKDRRAAAVPKPLRRVLAPFRPFLDPIRHTKLVQTLRNQVARPFRYPPLPQALAQEMERFYQPDKDALRVIAPELRADWMAHRTP